MADGDIRTLVERFYDTLWNAWDDDAVEQVLAPGFRFRGSLGQETVGRDGWRGYRDGIRAGAPDFRNTIVDLVAADDRAAARLSYSGTHLGRLLDLEPTGRRFTYAGAAFFTGADGFLTSAWVLGDVDALRRRLT